MSERLEPQTVIDGRYAVERRLGSGGMADVYLATDLQLGRPVALKVLYRRFAEDPEFVERFRREASAAAGLQHQHVVAVYDRGEWDGTYYIAMEYLDGRSLKQLVTEHAPMDPSIAIGYAIQILRAARFAHRRGVIHRDLKPHNVIVDEEGVATVTDFGIARAGASDMTQTGSIMGTAQYLSPEQARGDAVSAQSDLYSIGIVLYEMLAGRVPFEGDSAVAIALKQVGEAPVPPSAYNAAVTPALEAVVLRALEKDPAARFADADEFIAALEAAEAQPDTAGATAVGLPPVPVPVPVPPAGPHDTLPPSYGHPPPVDDEGGPGRRWWIFALVALAVVGTIVAVLVLTRSEPVAVPSVVGSDEATAQSVLQRAGFSVDTVTKTSTSPKGQVIGQSPEGGSEADEGSTVTITVSDGPGTKPVPDVDGLSAGQARRRLEDAGFRVRVRERADDEVPEGDAIETQPAAGTQLEVGGAVTLVVSTGRTQVTVPSVVGQSREVASANLQAADFTVSVSEREDADAEPGTVLSQTPAGGQKADQGSQVQIVIARTPAQVAVPNTIGEDEATAISDLEGAGFRVSERQVAVDSEDQDGIVVEQSPQGGRAKPGSTVRIGVGSFTPPTQPTTPTPGGSVPDGTGGTG
jgi:serine/threonine-protein kinase